MDVLRTKGEDMRSEYKLKIPMRTAEKIVNSKKRSDLSDDATMLLSMMLDKARSASDGTRKGMLRCWKDMVIE